VPEGEPGESARGRHHPALAVAGVATDGVQLEQLPAEVLVRRLLGGLAVGEVQQHRGCVVLATSMSEKRPKACRRMTSRSYDGLVAHTSVDGVAMFRWSEKNSTVISNSWLRLHVRLPIVQLTRSSIAVQLPLSSFA
jgi:hypothetical protein